MSANFGEKKEDKMAVSSPDKFIKALGLKSTKENTKKSFTSNGFENER